MTLQELIGKFTNQLFKENLVRSTSSYLNLRDGGIEINFEVDELQRGFAFGFIDYVRESFDRQNPLLKFEYKINHERVNIKISPRIKSIRHESEARFTNAIHYLLRELEQYMLKHKRKAG